MDLEADVDLQTQEILLASSHHDLTKLRALLRNTPATVQDAETGFTPLHAAIAACGHDDQAPQHPNGTDSPPEDQQEDVLAAAERTLRFLFQNGAIWNDLDANNETPGCLARRLGLMSLYEILVDAGVRAELLLNRLDDYETLQDEETEDDEVHEDDEKADNEQTIAVVQISDAEENKGDPAGGAGLAEELESTNDASTDSTNYLHANLQFQNDRLLDDSRNGVMMDWEAGIMKRTADLLLPTSGLTVLNIGHGMGIIDTFIQERSPAIHHIVEAHPQVLQQMRCNGWTDRPNVIVHDGKWQDVLPRLAEENTVFDAIFYDTFAEDYKAFRYFFGEHVIGLLNPDGLWGFFHGLGADRQICYDVYTKVVEMDLFEAGFDIDWETVGVPDLEQSQEWQGVRRRYWALDNYKLPICRFVG